MEKCSKDNTLHRKILRTGLEPATFCSEDRCSTIEPPKLARCLNFIIYDLAIKEARSEVQASAQCSSLL
eukprot:scaffold11749_cov77-Cyclotella_meneghiniana.AAC.2